MKIRNFRKIFIYLLILLVSTFFVYAQIVGEANNRDTIIVVCGDGICSLGETPENCPQDCGGRTFSVGFFYEDIRVMAETLEEFEILILNRGEDNTVFYIEKDDTLDLVYLKDTNIVVNSNERKAFSFYVNSSQKYVRENTGNIIIRNNRGEEETIPLKILVENLNLNLRSDFTVLGSEFSVDGSFKYFLSLRFLDEVRENITIRLSANPFDGSQRFILEEFTIEYFTQYDSIRKVDLGRIITTETGDYLVRDFSFVNQQIEPGDYLLNLEIISSRGIDIRTDRIRITNFFYEKWYVRWGLLVVLFLPIVIVLMLIIFRVRNILRAKKRYLRPVYSQLPKLRGDSIYFEVGKLGDTNKKAYLRANDFLTHGLVAGSTGSGKSVSASIIIEEALNHKIPVVVFDPTSQWTGFLSPLKDKNILKFYENFNMSVEQTRSYKGLIYLPKDENFNFDINECLNPGEITVFDLASLSIPQYERAVYRIIHSLFSKHWEESPDLKLLVVFDEMHRLLDKSCDGTGYQALTKACREFRKWGLGLIMASQIGSDFKEAIGGNVLTEIQLNTKNLSDIRNIAKKYSQEYADRVARQGIGVGLVSNPRYNKGMPWFIRFRPPLHNPHKLTEEELEKYDKYTKQISLMKEKLAKLSDEDKSNVMLDFKLASDKLREGKFKMAEIYLNTLVDYFKKKGI